MYSIGEAIPHYYAILRRRKYVQFDGSEILIQQDPTMGKILAFSEPSECTGKLRSMRDAQRSQARMKLEEKAVEPSTSKPQIPFSRHST